MLELVTTLKHIKKAFKIHYLEHSVAYQILNTKLANCLSREAKRKQ